MNHQQKLKAAQAVHGVLPEGNGLTVETIASWMQKTPKHVSGDIALPCFPLCKLLRTSPVKIAMNLAKNLDAVASGPYLNFTA